MVNPRGVYATTKINLIKTLENLEILALGGSGATLSRGTTFKYDFSYISKAG